MRFVYVDESGFSKRDPWCVVAGCFVHGDDQVVRLEEHLEGLVHKHIPKEDRHDFVFHAADILNGVGYFKDRGWSVERRADILADLCAIPRLLDLPVVFGSTEKVHLPFDPEFTEHQKVIASHLTAFMKCILNVEALMRMVWPQEIAQIVAENNEESKKAIKETYSNLRRRDAQRHFNTNDQTMPLRNIRGAVHFVEKDESRPMQLADACAYVIRGFLSGNPRCLPFYLSLRELMLLTPNKDQFGQPPVTAWPFGPLIINVDGEPVTLV